MSTTTQEQETTMPPQTKEHQLSQSIRQYDLEDWLVVIPGGFRTIRLLPDWKIALLLIKVSVLLFTLLTAYSEVGVRDLGWYNLLVVACVAGVVFAFTFGLTRKVVFDLEKNEISVTLLGSPVSRKNLHDFTDLSFRYGTTLYIGFRDESRIRVADPGQKVAEILESFILEALAMSEVAPKDQKTLQQRPMEADKPEAVFSPDQHEPVLTLEALRMAVWADTESHTIKKLAELLIMALNDWPRETLEVKATIAEMKAWFGEPLTIAQIKSPPLHFSMQYNAWRQEAGISLIKMIELSTKLNNESDFDQIVAHILDYYGLGNLS